jgi:hypothetical protein
MNETNQRRTKFFARLVPPLAVLALSLACASPPPPVHATLQVPTLRVHDQPEVTTDGMTISVTPITAENVARFPMIWKHLSWTSTGTSSTGAVVATQSSGEMCIVPLPAFEVRIANGTGHVVRFTNVVFRLQPDLGQPPPLFSGTQELQAHNENVIATQNPSLAGNPQIGAQIRAAVGSLRLLDRNTELLNGDSYTGYLVFNLGTNTYEEQVAWMNAAGQRLRLRIAEVPTQLDEAGNVSHTTEFEFNLDKTTAPVAVTCPPGTQPSLDSCSRG